MSRSLLSDRKVDSSKGVSRRDDILKRNDIKDGIKDDFCFRRSPSSLIGSDFDGYGRCHETKEQ